MDNWTVYLMGLVGFMNPRLVFTVFGSFYLSVLAGSYLLASFYAFLDPFGWFVIPVMANFFVGYFVRDVYKAIKIIIVGFSLQSVMILALLYSSSGDVAFFGVRILSVYYALQVPLGITASVGGTAIREDRSEIVAASVHLVKDVKETIQTRLSRVGRQYLKKLRFSSRK